MYVLHRLCFVPECRMMGDWDGKLLECSRRGMMVAWSCGDQVEMNLAGLWR